MSPLVFVRFFPKPGNEARVESILRGMIAPTRQEPGCLRYDFYESNNTTASRIFCLVERYADAAAQQAHRETSHYKDYRANIMDLLAQPIEVNLLDPLDER
jgi:quinol monooxygenase YgiN